MTSLHISPDLALPADFATEGVAVIGMRGSGKSNTEVRFAEVLYEAGIPWVAVDPKGDWWGIRSSADGKSPGMSVPIFGGLHQDFPLEPGTGARIADLLVDQMLSAVLDVSQLSKTGQLPAFLTAFCNQLMHRHQLDPHVRTVILEEAHRYIPQSVRGEHAVVKEAAAAVLLEGRSFGLGCWATTQRPARLNKDVLEEVGNAIIHRVGIAATNDKKTVRGWVEHYELSGEIIDSLTELGDGEAWVLMPQNRIVKRVQMDRRTTFDSGGTPKVGASTRRPSTLADIDQGAIKESLNDVIERAKADDPKELRRRIKDLERQLAERPTETVTETVVETVEVPALSDDALNEIEALRGSLTEALERWGNDAHDRQDLPRTRPAGDGADPVADRARPGRAPQRPDPPIRREPRRAPVPRTPTTEGDVKLGAGEYKILTAIAQHDQGVTPEQLSVLTSYKRSSRNTYVQRLKSANLVETTGSQLLATAAGLDVLGPDFEPLPTGTALRDYWMGQLPEGERRIFAILTDAWPDWLPGDDLDQQTGYKRSSRNTYLQRLRARQLVETDRGAARASDLLFDEPHDRPR